jgi:hypothetical protein
MSATDFLGTALCTKFHTQFQVPMYPIIVQDTSLSRVWFKQDDEFLLPKANLSFEFVRLVIRVWEYKWLFNFATVLPEICQSHRSWCGVFVIVCPCC